MNAPFKLPLSVRRGHNAATAQPDISDQSGSAIGSMDGQFEADLLELEPFLRSFARNLARDRELAGDLVQDTLLSAWRARSSYKPQTNLKAWLCIILRNRYYSHLRRSWRQLPWDPIAAERVSKRGPRQTSDIELSDALRALQRIPADQREALTLVGAGGFSYKEAAEICKCKEGTLKNRVVRARRLLTALLEGSEALPAATTASRSALEKITSELANLAFGAGKVGFGAKPVS